jgi:hypothetical protein
MTWTAPRISRRSTPTIAGERQLLEAWLDFHRQTLLSMYLHMIEEYARHNGHADLLRERTDSGTVF